MTNTMDNTFSNPATNINIPCDLYFFRFTTMKASKRKAKPVNCNIILSSLLKEADVFSRLAIFRLMRPQDKRSLTKSD